MKRLVFLGILFVGCTDTLNDAQHDVPSAPSTVILPGLPGLEWMTENLSGFGGTEIDGNTYYTWDEAIVAAGQLGDGWRLPTDEEQEALCKLGSTWDDDRKGRWFGGGLFLDAVGARYSTGLSYVGTLGYYWSSSSEINLTGYLWFSSDRVSQYYSGRAIGFSVRCVRDVE